MTPGLSPSWTLLPALIRRFGCQLQHPATWSAPPLARLRACTQNFCRTTKYDCKEQPVADQPAQPSGAGGSAAANAGAQPPPPIAFSFRNQLHETYFFSPRHYDDLIPHEWPENMATSRDDHSHIGPVHVDQKIMKKVLRAVTDDTVKNQHQSMLNWCKLQ